MNDAAMSSECLAGLLGHLGRSGGPEGRHGGLTPAQWSALRYMARANALSRTVSGLAAYQGTTRGTVSQTVKALVAAGYLRGRRCSWDGRSVNFELTAAGAAKLADDAGDPLVVAVAHLPADKRRALADAASELAGILVRRGDGGFGTCHSCRHCACDADGTPHCRSAGRVLAPEECDALCVAYAPMSGKGEP